MRAADCEGDPGPSTRPGHCSALCSLIEKSCLMSDHQPSKQSELPTLSPGFTGLDCAAWANEFYWFEHWKVGRLQILVAEKDDGVMVK